MGRKRLRRRTSSVSNPGVTDQEIGQKERKKRGSSVESRPGSMKGVRRKTGKSLVSITNLKRKKNEKQREGGKGGARRVSRSRNGEHEDNRMPASRLTGRWGKKANDANRFQTIKIRARLGEKTMKKKRGSKERKGAKICRPSLLAGNTVGKRKKGEKKTHPPPAPVPSQSTKTGRRLVR